jgi:hypothetical protein
LIGRMFCDEPVSTSSENAHVFPFVVLQASQPATVPVTLQADVSLWLILATAFFNPALVATALYLGRDTARKGGGFDKMLVAGFIAAIAGVALIWIAAWFRLPIAGTIGRAAAGLFAVSIITGAVWAAIGRRFFK